MASKEDDNKLRVNRDVNSSPEANIVNVYKRLESVLNNKSESFQNKVESLVQVWKQVSQCRLTEQKDYVVHLMDWLKLHTLNIVLTGDWKKYKDVYEEKLLKEVKHCEMLLAHSNNIFSLRCRKLAEVIKDPWGSPILNRLLKDPDVTIGPQEIEFFCMETGYLISTRLRKLCESHCEDLALNLVGTFMRCHQMAEAQQFSLNATEDQKRFILDVYMALLYKYKKTAFIVSTLKTLSLKDGLELLRRFAHKRVNISKIWKNSNRIAHLAAQVYVTAAVMKSPEESLSILQSLLDTWFSLNDTGENIDSLMSAIRRIVQAAEYAAHMYVFCEEVYKKFGTSMKTFIIELYIRSLTTGMNELERQKNEDDAEKALETTRQLANGFMRLADVLDEHVKVSRECVLTAFSLLPTADTLDRIVRLAQRSGFEVLDTGQNWKCKFHPPLVEEDLHKAEVLWKCDTCGEHMSQPQFVPPLNTNIALSEALTAEQLGLSSQLCDDLVVVLSSPRYQLFNWLLHWKDLHRLCILYLNNPEGTKNLVTELKFLDIDYSMFVGMKREPEDEDLTGIERGYEQYLEEDLYHEEVNSEDSASQDSRQFDFGSDCTSEGSLLPYSPGKSDPNVLKSLRLFRPALKRNKRSAENSPTKVFVTENLTSPFSSTQPSVSSCQFNNQQMTMPSGKVIVQRVPDVPNAFMNLSGLGNSSGLYIHDRHPMNYNRHSPDSENSPNACPRELPDSNLNYSNVFPHVTASSPRWNSPESVNSDSSGKLDMHVQHKADLMQKSVENMQIGNSRQLKHHARNYLQHRKIEQAIPKCVLPKSVVADRKIHSGRKNTCKGLDFSYKKETLQQNVTIDRSKDSSEKAIKKYSCQKTPSKEHPDQPISQLKSLLEKECRTTLVSSVSRPNPYVDMSKNLITYIDSAINEAENNQIHNRHSSQNLCDNKNITKTITTTTSPQNSHSLVRSNDCLALHKEKFDLDSPVTSQKVVATAEDSHSTPHNMASKTPHVIIKKTLKDITSKRSNIRWIKKAPKRCRSAPCALPERPTIASHKNSHDRDTIPREVSPSTNKRSGAEILDINFKSHSNKQKFRRRSKSVPPRKLQKSIGKNYSVLECEGKILRIKMYGKNLCQSFKSSSQETFDINEQSSDSICSSKNLISASSGLENDLESFTKTDAGYYLREDENVDSGASLENVVSTETEMQVDSTNEQATLDTDDKSMDLLKKFKIKEARVILHRVSLGEYCKKKIIKPAPKFIKPATPKRKRRRVFKKMNGKSENKRKDTKRRLSFDTKTGSKPSPLQDVNPKVIDAKDKETESQKFEKGKADLQTDDLKHMNPFVVLKRLEVEKYKKRSVNTVFANVPGLNDLQMIRPSSVDRIVQVVQVPGTRTNANTVSIQNTQTSTQVTPHIQRIGQPRIEKPPMISDSNTMTTAAASTTTSTSTTASTTASDSPTLINILSQQIIRPSNQTNCVGGRPRSSQLINILSQQIIKPVSTSVSAKVASSSSSEVQVNSIPRVISGGDQIINQLINPVRAPAPALKTLVGAPTSDQNRIVQFICKSSDGKLIPVTSFTSNKVVKVSMTPNVPATVATNTNADENFKLTQVACKIKQNPENLDSLPKFQQAFGKPAYQNNVDSADCVIIGGNDGVSSDIDKTVAVAKNQPKNSTTSLNVQPVQGGVIYTRQMPVGQTINLIPPGRGQVFRIATSNAEQLSLVKDTVIHGKMSALLAAALQGKQQQQLQQRTDNSEQIEISSEENSPTCTRVQVTTRPTLVQNARIVKPVLQIPSNVIRSTPQSNLSSTTLEQLREFDMVYKQVKERSSTSATTESSPQSDSNEQPAQQISVTYLNQGQKINCAPVVVVSSYCNVQPAASPSLSVTSQGSSSPCVTPAPTLTLSSKTVNKNAKTKSIKNATTHTAKASPIPKPQQKPQEDEHTTQRIFDILAEYAEQLRNSPDLNNKPAPRRRSNPPTNPNQNAKRKKSSSSKKTGHCSNSLSTDGDLEDTHTVGSEDSSCGVVQISVQEEEQSLSTPTTTESSEPASSPKQLILTDSTANAARSLIIADSNVGEALKMSNTAVLVPGNYIMPVSMVKGGQQIAVVSGGSKILATVPARSGPNMLLFQSFLNQTRKHGLSTVKYSTVQPISGIARNISNVSAQTPTAVTTSPNVTTVTLAQTVALQKVTPAADRSDINNFDTELLLTIAQPPENKIVTAEQPQPEQGGGSTANLQNVRVSGNILNTEANLDKTYTYEEKSPLVNASVATSVIAQSINIKEELTEETPTSAPTIMALNLNSSDSAKDTTIKVEGRVQSVLVTTGTSNGPMLSHSPPNFNKQTDSTNSISESTKDEYLRNEGKRSNTETKTLQSSVYAYQSKIKKSQSSHRLDRELQQLSLQRKQAALERELRLQKSLSEECEDLGVDEPSTSDLFPEADLLFDSNHSPSFDQSSQDIVKRSTNPQDSKEENKAIGLFCDDEPIRTDFLFEPIEFQSGNVGLEYNRTGDMANGQGSASNESGFSCEDNTLLQTCTSMSDVTIPSPISPDTYAESSPPPLNKCKYKYSNRKKAERSKHVENWPMELSSSEDTTGSTELVKSCSRSPEIYPGKRQSLSCDEDDRDLIGFTIVERLPLKEDDECEELHCQEAADCPSGRGARRSVKKLCSCCNGSAKVPRKRPASRPPTPFSHKKTVIAKKR